MFSAALLMMLPFGPIGFTLVYVMMQMQSVA
jgi:hypothetical protein